MVAKTLGIRGGDFLVHSESSAVNLVSGQLENATLAIQNLEVIPGYPVKVGTGAGLFQLALVADEAAIVGFLVYGPPVVALAATSGVTSTASLYTIVNLGPGVVNGSNFPVNDAAGAALTQATLKTEAEALGLKVIFAPSLIETQTT